MATDALYYQVDLLKTMNEKLNTSDRINKRFLELSDNAYFYYNFADDYFESIGNWEDIFELNIKKHIDIEMLIEEIRADDQQSIRELLNCENRHIDYDSKEFRLKRNHTWVECSVSVSYNDLDEPVEKFVCLRDITQFKIQNDELSYMAYYDSLTGLHNRNFFVKELQEMVLRASQESASVTVAMLDIDDFKKVNDSIGLILGDELIQNVGMFLKDLSSKDTLIGRFGADVFIIAIYDPKGKNTFEEIYRLIKQRLKRPFVLSNKDEINVTMSVGVAEYPDAGESGFVLIKNAEICMFKAKEKSRGGVYYFDQELLDAFIESVSLENKLREAINGEEFLLYYQPQYDARTGALRGAEALIRWKNQDGSLVSPAKFIPVAEKSGGIIPIGNWVLREALKSLAIWQKSFGYKGVLSVNFSAVQFKKDDFVESVIKLINEYDVIPSNFEVEITESVFIDDLDMVIEKMERLHKAGIRISLDDFGTGFSSLSYLKELPIDTLKIDKTFIDTVLSDDSTSIITEHLVNMVKKLGLETIAEGVETEEQFKYLQTIDCDMIQGFLLGKPMPKDDFELLIMKNQARA